jgi:hypothetical protein
MPGWLFSPLRSYERPWLRGDLIAGFTVWAVFDVGSLDILRRGAVLERVEIAPTLDAAAGSEPLAPVT